MRRRNFKIKVSEDNWVSFQQHAFYLGYKWRDTGRNIRNYNEYERYVTFIGMYMFPIKQSSYYDDCIRIVQEEEFFKFNRLPTKVSRNIRKYV